MVQFDSALKFGNCMEASTSQERILNLYLKNKGALVTSIDTYIFCNKNERINVHPCCNLVCLLVSFDDYTRNEFVSLIHLTRIITQAARGLTPRG
ncbi:unnamed protein product, partial [Vitis vinifera]